VWSKKSYPTILYFVGYATPAPISHRDSSCGICAQTVRRKSKPEFRKRLIILMYFVLREGLEPFRRPPTGTKLCVRLKPDFLLSNERTGMIAQTEISIVAGQGRGLRLGAGCVSLVLGVLLAACGGGGRGSGGTAPSSTPSPPPPSTSPQASAPTSNLITLHSDPGDPIGLGLSYGYTSADSIITVSEATGLLSISVQGDQQWSGNFLAPNAMSPLKVGSYLRLSNFPVVDPTVGAFRWYGEGRGCVSSVGSVTIDSVGYTGGNLAYISLHFDRFCDGSSAALHGQVQWTYADTTAPPGVITPIPTGLWQPAPGSTPVSGNYVVVQSDSGDLVGLGGNFRYTDQDALISVQGGMSGIFIQTFGQQQWYGSFGPLSSQNGLLQPGYYPSLIGEPFYNPTRGGLSWTGDGRGCVTLSGWMAVDRATYANLQLTGLDLRFEQQCAGSTAMLHGAIHWDLPAPAGGPPATLSAPGSWHAPVGSSPPNGNYAYLSSDLGDFIGTGQINLYTPLDAVITATANSGLLALSIGSVRSWNGIFQAPAGQVVLQPGVYAGLSQYASAAPPSGSMMWVWDGRGCAKVQGWTAIDDATYAGGVLSSIDLRFEQACDQSPGTLKGQVHWSAADGITPTGPIDPPPTPLWHAPAGVLPASGNYVYIQSDRSDPVGLGLVTTFTQANSQLDVKAAGGGIDVNIVGDTKWTTHFQPMSGLAHMQPGYYGGLGRANFDFPVNPAKGGIDANMNSNGCNTVIGGFVVDGVSYSGNQLSSLDLRFEQHCEEAPGAVRGVVHWTPNDPTVPPGPVNPPPSFLWQPAAGKTPSTGTFVYLESQNGDFLGNGITTLDIAPPAVISVTSTGAALSLTLSGSHQASADFIGMSSLTQLQAGYYGDLQESPLNNPAKGGISWIMNGIRCNSVTGWFAIDSVTYAGNVLNEIDLRFEMYCDSSTVPLRGRVRWER
jgi:hypothetical protein